MVLSSSLYSSSSLTLELLRGLLRGEPSIDLLRFLNDILHDHVMDHGLGLFFVLIFLLIIIILLKEFLMLGVCPGQNNNFYID